MGTQQLIEYFHLNIIATLIQNVIGLLSVADNNCFWVDLSTDAYY